MHQHDNNNANVFHQFTNGNTGSGNNTSGFRMGIEFVGGVANRSDVWFRNWQNNGQFNFASNDNVGAQQRRILIQNQGYLNNEVTRVKIIENDFVNPAFVASPPLSLLHLGHHWLPNAGGHRLWMDVGSYTCASSDQLYVGLKEATNSANNPWTAHMDAVINWGDNIQGQEGADNLRVILTTPQVANNGDAGTVEGLEVMRFTPLGRIGVGNFDNVNGSGVQPLRRLEIYDENVQNINFPTAIQFTSAPQLRLTFTPNVNVNLGINTDFQTMATGDLFINPRNAGVNRFVGINTSTPLNTLEINSTAGVSPFPSGLRFTNLNSTSANDISPNGKVLTVDGSGHVVMTDGGTGSVNSICTTQDIIARFDNTGNVIQCSDIYNNASATPNNRIGFFTTTPQYKFQMEGTALFTRNQITTPFGLTVHGQNNPPAVMIESKDDEGLSILHSATTSPNVKDQMKIYGDDNRQYHLRMVGTPTGNSTPNSITFDHEDNGGSVNSWMGYNTLSRITVMKDDFNSNPVPASPAGIVLGYAVYASKFFVEAQTPTYAGNYMVYGLTAGNTNSNSEKYHAGVFGYSSGSRIGQVSNKGAMFYATGASGSNTSSLGSNIGVEAKAISTSTFTDSYGVYTTALGGQHTNYGIYSLVKGSGCANGSCTSAAGFFNGAVYTTQNTYFTSDSSLKQNITPIGLKDTLLNHIPVYSFNYDTLNNYGLNLEIGTHYGVLAHEVKQVLPQMVRNFIQPAEYDSSGTIVSQLKNIQAVNYTEFIPLLIAGYKSQAKEIDTLTSQLTTLQSRLDSLVMAVASCCNAPLLNQNNSSNQQTIELDNTPAIILGNDPNPFAENTTISWNIPQQDTETINAMLVFYNQNGSILKSVKIHQAGAGSLLVYGSNLSSGQYSYSLVVNNKVVKTKQMVKVK